MARTTSLCLSCLTALLLALTASACAQEAAALRSATAPVADPDNGTTIWDHACAACHGELGQGSRDGVPDIRNTELSLDEIRQLVKEGAENMPAFAGFSEKELLDVSSYVKNQL